MDSSSSSLDRKDSGILNQLWQKVRERERESFEVTKNKTSRRGRNSVTARGPIDCCWRCRRSGQFANYQKILRRTGQEETSSNRLLAPSDAGVNECKHWFTVTQSAGTTATTTTVANWISQLLFNWTCKWPKDRRGGKRRGRRLSDCAFFSLFHPLI